MAGTVSKRTILAGTRSKVAHSITDLQIPHLDTFSKAAELASFTRAAELLCMTQAAISQHVHMLERSLNVALFRRRGGRVELTDAGRCLYEYAQRILALHEEARRALGQVTEQVAGDLRIAASTIPAEHFLMGLIAEFQKVRPQLRVVAEVGDSESVVTAVEQGKASLGIVGRRIPVSWAEYELFATDRLVLVVPPTQSWKKVRHVTIEQLRTEPMILRESGSGTRACFERALTSRNMTLADLHVRLEVGSNDAVKDAVLRQLGVAVLSIRTVQSELAAGRLLEKPIKGLDLTRELYIVTDRRRGLPSPARAFMHFLVKNQAAQPGALVRPRLMR
jgi:DNA-binding transcriptional LysR family regulator